MAAELERVVPPEYGDLKIAVSVSARIKSANATAQRTVSWLLLGLVGTQLCGESSSLVAEYYYDETR